MNFTEMGAMFTKRMIEIAEIEEFSPQTICKMLHNRHLIAHSESAASAAHFAFSLSGAIPFRGVFVAFLAKHPFRSAQSRGENDEIVKNSPFAVENIDDI